MRTVTRHQNADYSYDVYISNGMGRPVYLGTSPEMDSPEIDEMLEAAGVNPNDVTYE